MSIPCAGIPPPEHGRSEGLSLLPAHPTALDYLFFFFLLFFFISLLLQTGWQEVNGLLAQQSLLPHQGAAAWPDVGHPLFEGAGGDGATE